MGTTLYTHEHITCPRAAELGHAHAHERIRASHMYTPWRYDAYTSVFLILFFSLSFPNPKKPYGFNELDKFGNLWQNVGVGFLPTAKHQTVITTITPRHKE